MHRSIASACRLTLLALAIHFFPGLHAEDSPKWNLLLVTADDMNADSSGWMGNKLGATPNLDAFAATAHRFINHHVSAPICQPSRSAFMTGRVPHRNGALGFNPIKPGTPTLVTLLRDAGWFTAVIDKHAHMKPDTEFPWHLKLGGSGKNPKLFGEHVAQCLQAAADAKKPFFLSANITDPHRPFANSKQAEEQKKKPNKAARRANDAPVKAYRPEEVTVPSFLEDIPEVRREVAQYYTSVRRFDLSFGEMMAALKAAGREGDTLIVFLSDHGMSFPFSKASVYRNGTWSPVLLRWPGMGQPQRREEFVSSVDLLPTLLELLNQSPLAGVDGRSWMPLLRGETQPDRDFVITHVNTVSSGRSFAQRCVRTKEFSYQFHAWPNGTPHFRVEAMNGLSYKALAKAAESDSAIQRRVQQFVTGVPEQFFDLRADADERVNLIAEPKYASEVARLRNLLLAHMEKTGDPQLENFRNQRPNFVIIYADDMGYADIGPYGAKGIRTPNLDRMASEGMRFTDFYVAQAVCSASRAALLTGCYPNRIGILGALGPASKNGIHADELTIAEVLKPRGYATAIYGKWHLGHHPQFLPTRHGFDDYFGLPYSNDMWPNHPSAKPGTYPPLPLIEGEKAVEHMPDQTQLTTWYTERGVKFIEKNKDHPFFLYMPHAMPHVPLNVSDKFKGQSERGLYGDVIMEIDWSVGQILAALRKHGLEDRTLVIFTSDNGPWLLYGDHAGSAGPLREGKATTFEGGVRVPCIMRWPGKIAAGAVCRELAATLDILPTLAKLAGAEPPKDRIIDGKDIWPLISGQPGAKTPHETFFYYWAQHLQAVRSGKWKLHFEHGYPKPAPPGGNARPGRYSNESIGLELFDLEADVGERSNVAPQHPDVVKRLQALAENCREDLGDSATQRKGKNVRPAGQLAVQ